jgi:hypothetical protein
MSESNLRISNVTVDNAVRKVTPAPLSATSVDTNSFINFNNINFSKEKLITSAQIISMAKSGILIVDYTRPNTMQSSDPFIMLFNTSNDQTNVDNLVSIFNLSSTTPSRLIRVIRSGVNIFDTIVTTLGTSAVVAPTAIKYIFFQVNGDGGTNGDSNTRTSPFPTLSDWSFVVTLRNDLINGQRYNRICFNVII